MTKTVTMRETRLGPAGAMLSAGVAYALPDDLANSLLGSGYASAVVAPTGADTLSPAHATAIAARGGVFLRNSSGQSLHGASSSGAAIALTPATLGTLKRTAPVLYRTAQGVIARPGPSGAQIQGAVGYGGAVYNVDTNGTFSKYTPATGWAQVGSTNAVPGTISVWFVDSRGYHFYAPSSGAILYRSTDGCVTWAACLTHTGSTDTCAPICEDDLGNLYAGAYGSSSGGSVGFNNGLGLNSRKVYKSADGGATWAEISTAFPANGGGYTGPAGIDRHVHGCWWDNIRKWLIVTHGDAGAASKPYVSADRGATFSVMANVAQATALAATPGYLIWAADQSSDRRIYRMPVTTLASAVSGTPSVCWDWISQGGATDNSSTRNGYAWQCVLDEQGNLAFPFGIEGSRTSLMATGDQGDTWVELATQSSAGRTFHDFVQVSPFNVGRDGFQYGLDTKDGALGAPSQWRMYAIGSLLSVRGNRPSYQASGIASAMPGFIDAPALRSAGVLQALAGDITTPVLLTQANQAIGRNGFQLGAPVTTQPLLLETWEGTPSGWTQSISGTGVAPTQNDATHAKSGTQAAKFDLGAGAGASTSWLRRTTAPWGRTLVDGDEIWLTGYVWLTAITAARLGILEFGSIRVTATVTDAVNRLQVFNSTLAQILDYQALNEAVAFPAGQFNRVKIAITLGATANGTTGRVRVWQDTGAGYRLVIDAVGIPTYSGGAPANYFIGLETGGSGNFTTGWWDDVRFGLNSDPEMPPALTMTNTPQSVYSDGLFL